MALLRFWTPGSPAQSRTVQHGPAQSSTVQQLFWTAVLEVPKLQIPITFSSHLRLRCFLAFRNRHNMSFHILMSIPSWVLLFLGERQSKPHGVLSHTRPTWVLSPMARQGLGIPPVSPLGPCCCGDCSWRGARHIHSKKFLQ